MNRKSINLTNSQLKKKPKVQKKYQTSLNFSKKVQTNMCQHEFLKKI